MNVSLRWLRSLAPDLEGSPESLSERLAALGFPVESIHALGAGLGDVIVARVETVRPHPNADRLRLCQVDSGSGVVQVVCGAPNVEAGGWYALAPVGATLPGGMTLRKAKIRGEVSEGMLCSEIELGLGKGKDGLMTLDLDPESPARRPGAPLVEALGLDDVRLDVEVTSNRPDLLSHRGIARELAPAGDASLVDPEVPGAAPVAQAIREVGPEGGEAAGVSIRIEDPDLCPRYLGLVIRGVRVGPSPAWLQDRLRAAGARPISNVVDATNHVLLELGQPLHAFDLHRLGGSAIVVRRARAGETIRTLDGVDRTLAEGMLAICDAERPVAVAGVMGGENSEVGGGTTDILLECALFTPGPIRATRKVLGLSTDASYRFERGVDPDGLVAALLRCARLVVATAGGTVEGPVLDVARSRPEPRVLTLRIPRIAQVLGVRFTPDEVRSLLRPLGFGVEEDGGERLRVEVPGWRSWDVTREIDLVEEIARRHGYDRFPDTLAPYRPGSVPDHPLFQVEDGLRDLLAARGFLEAQTPAFAPEGEGSVEVLNPLSMEERRLRSALLPALLRRVEYNLARGNRDVRLHELGTVFAAPPAPGALPVERTHLALVLHGRRGPEHWADDEAPTDLWELKGILEAAAARLGAGALRVEGVEGGMGGDGIGKSPFDAGWGFRVVDADGVEWGRGGRVDRRRLDLPPWAGAVWAAELSLPEAPVPPEPIRLDPLPTHPGVERDLALLVEEGRPVAEVLALVDRTAGAHYRGSQVFDVYRGTGIPEGLRSVGVRLRFRADGRSLTDTEVDGTMTRIQHALQEELGVRIRGG
jgi:phenylalanyl-tRNA synthetase beta chain